MLQMHNLDKFQKDDILITYVTPPSQCKDLLIHTELFSVENNLLTPTFKLKRNDASKKFAPQIAEMYVNINAAFAAKGQS